MTVAVLFIDAGLLLDAAMGVFSPFGVQFCQLDISGELYAKFEGHPSTGCFFGHFGWLFRGRGGLRLGPIKPGWS